MFKVFKGLVSVRFEGIEDIEVIKGMKGMEHSGMSVSQ